MSRLAFFFVGVVTGVGASEYFGPFIRSTKQEVKSTGRAIGKHAQEAYDDIKDKAVDAKNAAKDKYKDIKSDIKKK